MLSPINQPGKPSFTREEVLEMISKLPDTSFYFGHNGWSMSGCSPFYTVNPEEILQELEKYLPRS